MVVLSGHDSIILGLQMDDMALSNNKMVINETVQNHYLVSEERFCIFRGALGMIGQKNLNWFETDENKKLVALWC